MTLQTLPISSPTSFRFSPSQVRFPMAIALDGEQADLPLTQINPEYEDMGALSFKSLPGVEPFPLKPSTWVSTAILRTIGTARSEGLEIRPLHVPVPLCGLDDPNLAEACFAAIERADIDTGEICLEIRDASINEYSDLTLDTLDVLRRAGFEFSLDLRMSWETPLGIRLRNAIRRARVETADILIDETLQNRCRIVSGLGGQVVVDHASRSQIEALIDCGVTHAIKLHDDPVN